MVEIWSNRLVSHMHVQKHVLRKRGAAKQSIRPVVLLSFLYLARSPFWGTPLCQRERMNEQWMHRSLLVDFRFEN